MIRNCTVATKRVQKFTAATLLAGAAIACPSVASAAFSGASDATALDVNIGLVGGLVGVFVGPLPVASGNAPNVYDVQNTTASVNASAIGVADLSTGLLTAHAESNIGPSSVTGSTSADSEVDGLELEIVPGILITPDLVNLSATTIASNAMASFNGTTTQLLGGIVIEDAVLSVAGVGNIVVNANAAPNTVLLNALGIRIVLNEQITTITGDTHSIEVNAIHITIDGALNVVNADVVIARSYAEITIPAPAGVTLAAVPMAFAMRRRRTS